MDIVFLLFMSKKKRKKVRMLIKYRQITLLHKSQFNRKFKIHTDEKSYTCLANQKLLKAKLKTVKASIAFLSGTCALPP